MGDQIRGYGGVWNDPIDTPPGEQDADYSSNGGVTLTITTDGINEIFTWDETHQCYYDEGAGLATAKVRIEYTCVVSNEDGCVRWLWTKSIRGVHGNWGVAATGFALKNS